MSLSSSAWAAWQINHFWKETHTHFGLIILSTQFLCKFFLQLHKNVLNLNQDELHYKVNHSLHKLLFFSICWQRFWKSCSQTFITPWVHVINQQQMLQRKCITRLEWPKSMAWLYRSWLGHLIKGILNCPLVWFWILKLILLTINFFCENRYKQSNKVSTQVPSLAGTCF